MNIRSFIEFKKIVLNNYELLKKSKDFKIVIGVYFIYNAMRLSKMNGNLLK